MAKKVEGYIKLQIPAGKATPAPPVGPALGQHGVNIVEFTKQFNARTADKGDTIIPVVITVYADRSFSFKKYHIFKFVVWNTNFTVQNIVECSNTMSWVILSYYIRNFFG